MYVQRRSEFQDRHHVVVRVLGLAVVAFAVTMTMGPEHFNGLHRERMYERPLNRLYFVLTTVTTVGYGDITPRTAYARLVGTLILLGMITVVMS